MLVGAPLRALWRWLRGGAMAESDRAVATRRVAAAALALAVPLAALPWPDATVAQGVLWLPEHALVRAQSAGFVQAVLVADGQAVQRGDALVQLHSPELPAQLQGLQGRIAALQSEQAMSLREDPARAMGAAHALRAATLEWDQLQQRLADLTVRAQTAGRVSIAHAADLPGRHVARGALLAHVITGESGIVRVAIPQERAALVAGHPGAVAVRRADARAAPLAGRWSGTPSGGGALLPSAALGEAAGGRIATDPQDQQGLRPTQPVMLGEVQLDGAPAERLGERVLVRFDHGLAPLAWQAARALQQQLLRHFNPAQ
jgi:putative peptide zinc metalloprotease protein